MERKKIIVTNRRIEIVKRNAKITAAFTWIAIGICSLATAGLILTGKF